MKNPLLISLILILSFQLIIPTASATLSTGESVAAVGVTFLIFLFGLVLAIFGLFTLRGEYKVVGMFCIGLGLIVILYSLNAGVVMSNEITEFSLSGKMDKVFGQTMVGIKIMSYLILIFFVGFVAKLFMNIRSNKSQNDGWDDNSY